MLWLIQNNLRSRDTDESRFLQNLERLSIKYLMVNIFPFVEKIFHADVTSDQIETTQPLDYSNRTNVVINGSVIFSRLAQKQNITPGAFATNNSDFPNLVIGYGKENLLNGDGRYGKLKDIKARSENTYYFIRPVKDSKAFSGMEMNGLQFKNWKHQLLQQPTNADSILTGDTEIVIASSKQIYKEFRFFIVDGKIVTYSQYKSGGGLLISSDPDSQAEYFVQQMLKRWNPCRAYVMDVCSTPKGWKVVELNAFGSAGFYACDTQKIIMAVEGM